MTGKSALETAFVFSLLVHNALVQLWVLKEAKSMLPSEAAWLTKVLPSTNLVRQKVKLQLFVLKSWVVAIANPCTFTSRNSSITNRSPSTQSKRLKEARSTPPPSSQLES